MKTGKVQKGYEKLAIALKTIVGRKKSKPVGWNVKSVGRETVVHNSCLQLIGNKGGKFEKSNLMIRGTCKLLILNLVSAEGIGLQPTD